MTNASSDEHMNTYIVAPLVSTKRIARILCISGLLAGSGHAQEASGYLVLFPSVGLAPGQSLRLTLFQPDGQPIRARAQVHHSGGIVVALGDGSVRAGEFQSFDFKRADIPIPGEPGTGRLQLRASLHLTIRQPAARKLSFSMETVSVTDGTSNTFFIGEAFPSPRRRGGDDLLIAGSTTHELIGVARGQTLRVTVFATPPGVPAADAQSGGPAPATGHITIFDSVGNIIAQSARLEIPPGEFRSFDLVRDSLGLPGEPGTGRQQLRIASSIDFKSRQHSQVLISVETINTSTGTTQVLSGDECLVFFLGGTPSR